MIHRTTTAGFCRILTAALLLALAACSDETHHDNMAGGAPNNWWSDNYLTMVADANGMNATPAAPGKPVRMKLP